MKMTVAFHLRLCLLLWRYTFANQCLAAAAVRWRGGGGIEPVHNTAAHVGSHRAGSLFTPPERRKKTPLNVFV